jgi:hypothetical protein
MRQHHKTKSRRAQAYEQVEMALGLSPAAAPPAEEQGQFDHCEFVDCRMSDELFAQGGGHVIVCRRLSLGRVVFATYLLDIGSLGVKHASVRRGSDDEYEAYLQMFEQQLGATKNIEPAYACGLVLRVAEHAAWLGFAPHRSYASAAPLLAGIDVSQQHFALDRDQQPLPRPHDAIETDHDIYRGLESRLAAERFLSAW